MGRLARARVDVPGPAPAAARARPAAPPPPELAAAAASPDLFARLLPHLAAQASVAGREDDLVDLVEHVIGRLQAGPALTGPLSRPQARHLALTVLEALSEAGWVLAPPARLRGDVRAALGH